MGHIEVVDLAEYPEDEVDEAIKYCPEDCIYWEEDLS
jgi:ferredoxin